MAPPGHASLPAARHLLVWFLWAQRRIPEAEQQMRLVDGYIGALPWTYHSDPVALYSPLREHLVLHGNPVAVEGPEFLDEPVVQLSRPFSREKSDDLIASVHEFARFLQ